MGDVGLRMVGMTTFTQLPDPTRLAALTECLDRPNLPMAPMVIGAIAPELANRLGAAGRPVRESDGVWYINVVTLADIDPALADMVRWLFTNRFTGTRHEELLAVIGHDRLHAPKFTRPMRCRPA